MSLYNKLALFVGGALFGSVGIKLLSSKDAKKAYEMCIRDRLIPSTGIYSAAFEIWSRQSSPTSFR